jgi:hypothetical protein
MALNFFSNLPPAQLMTSLDLSVPAAMLHMLLPHPPGVNVIKLFFFITDDKA